jgi:Domain of unknown function (DUF397)
VGQLGDPGAPAPRWRRSSACANGECVEVALREDQVLVRSSRSPQAVLALPRPAWQALLAALRPERQ